MVSHHSERPTVRRARLEDAAALAPLLDDYREFYGQSPNPAAAAGFLRERLAASEAVIFVAAAAERLVGFTTLYPCFSTVSLARVWVLNDLFVAPTHRRSGVASELMNAGEAFASDDGAVRLVLATAVDNAPAKSLYADRGWRIDSKFDHYAFEVADQQRPTSST